MNDAAHLFNQIDTDESGTIDADELLNHLLEAGSALGSGAAPALEELDLFMNQIGDEGARHLANALARGAAPALETLGLYRNPASAAAKQALRDARPGLEI